MIRIINDTKEGVTNVTSHFCYIVDLDKKTAPRAVEERLWCCFCV